MKSTFLSASLFISLLAMSANLRAETYNLQMTGTILSRTCEVENETQTVDIGKFSASDFTATGSVSAEKEFEIRLTGCDDSVSGVVIRFSGTADKDNSHLLALSDGDNVAKGVGIEIADNKTRLLIPINQDGLPAYSLTPGAENTLAFTLRYKSTQDVVVPGNAAAVMYFDLQYQ
ncbi:fimbrial protein [Scandinavium goeteborgense]|uniref:Type 1 fimbria pilin n=1 Tax=Scandinavium goeteborgense TaxID=1851514 RepID=A0A4R6DPS4_SCAGO|nr:fimbrial protein [Scandinavium goeteborgense]TDN47025.1 type 1 fimbria pilin [Scandinavium goeteborgense]